MVLQVIEESACFGRQQTGLGQSVDRYLRRTPVRQHPDQFTAAYRLFGHRHRKDGDAGITLGNATVGSESFRDQAAAERQATTPGFAGQPTAPVAEAGPTVPPATRRGNGLVDTFA